MEETKFSGFIGGASSNINSGLLCVYLGLYYYFDHTKKRHIVLKFNSKIYY